MGINTSYIPVRIIVPWIKWGDNDGNLPIVFIDILITDILFWAERGWRWLWSWKNYQK